MRICRQFTGTTAYRDLLFTIYKWIICFGDFERQTNAVKCLSVLYHSVNYIFISFGIVEPILVALKIEYRLSYEVYAASKTTLLHIKRLYKPTSNKQWKINRVLQKGPRLTLTSEEKLNAIEVFVKVNRRVTIPDIENLTLHTADLRTF